MKIGIVGLPNVGKSTLFNALTKAAVPAENYPFCTIDPSVGVVGVPDARLDQLAALSGSEKTIPAAIEFVDIAGLVKGASEGEGLGNQFLSHIREVDAILQMVRFFDDPDVTHVHGDVDPARDIEIINLELILADAQSVASRREKLVRDVKKSVNSDLSMEWLKPFMTERQCAAGEILFYKDEKAEDMLYIVSGKFKLVESGIVLPVGAIVGELGMLSPSNMRTQTLECVEAGLVLSVSYTKVEELYVQNPAFGFYFLRLASARLFQNLETLQQQLNQQTAAAAVPKPA